MRTQDFDYELPPERIAQVPAERRDEARMLVVERRIGALHHRRARDLPEYLRTGDLLVANNTRVIPARLLGRRETGGQAEVFLLKRLSVESESEALWNTLVRPGKRIKKGTVVYFQNCRLIGVCVEHYPDGSRDFLFRKNLSIRNTDSGEREPESLKDLIFGAGSVPLPPYIREPLRDHERYQTIYSEEEGAVAAPTAGLHFTDGLITDLKKQGTEFCTVTLHVGLGTFRPLEDEGCPFSIEGHIMHSESFYVKSEEVRKIECAKREKRRIIGIGTTSVRVLESLPFFEKRADGSYGGDTRLFIYPPFPFVYTNAMITNFHLPKSSLLLMVSAFASRELIMSAYEEAIENGYRFYSFGDACLIL